MIHERDIKAYRAIMPELKATELYLGMVYHAFYFTKAEYLATCTEAFPFNPFDKVICELLKVEESLSFNQIGDILGMNVYESENPKKYLDLAEKEILSEAIQSLASEEFGKMIEIGDIYMSKCRLTDTGREYAEKKCKFKVTENKPFTIYFDHTTCNHQLAKENFEFEKGTKIPVEFDLSFADERILKEIALTQIPEIYNPEKQYSFTDPVLHHWETFEIQLPVVVVINAIDNSTRLFCLDRKNKSLNDCFTKWFNDSTDRKSAILEAIKEKSTSEVRVPNSHFELFSGRMLSDVKLELLHQDLIDNVLFLLSIAELIEPSIPTTLYLTLPTINKAVTDSIIQCIQKSNSPESRFFIVLPNETEEKEDYVETLLDLASNSRNLYCMQRQVRLFFLGLKTDSSSNYYFECSTSLGDFRKDLIQKSQWDDKAKRNEAYLLEQFCEESALGLSTTVNQIINEDLEEVVTAYQIEKIKDLKFKLEPFKEIGIHSNTVKETIGLIDNFVAKCLKDLRNSIEQKLKEIEDELNSEINERTIQHSQKLFSQLNRGLVSNDDYLQKRISEVENLLTAKKALYEESQKVYNIIPDTNALINDPEILKQIDRRHRIIIAAKVLDELDNFKRKPELKKVASECISFIFKNPSKNIRRAKANVKLLPPDFSHNSPDNLILATALVYKSKNGVLVTDDKGLLEKAKHCELYSLSLSEFKLKFSAVQNV